MWEYTIRLTQHYFCLKHYFALIFPQGPEYLEAANDGVAMWIIMDSFFHFSLTATYTVAITIIIVDVTLICHACILHVHVHYNENNPIPISTCLQEFTGGEIPQSKVHWHWRRVTGGGTPSVQSSLTLTCSRTGKVLGRVWYFCKPRRKKMNRRKLFLVRTLMSNRPPEWG